MLTVRPTVVDDLDEVVAMEAAADTGMWLAETGRAWHERALADPDQEHLVTDTVIAGFVVLAGLHLGDGRVELRRMVVHPKYRRTGRGRALLNAALARAYELHHACQVWLDVKAPNLRARALYEAEGFVHTETVTGAMTGPDGTTTDLLIMTHDPGRATGTPR